MPVAGFAVLPSFLGQKRHKVDLGPVSDFAEGQWYIATFITDPSRGRASRAARRSSATTVQSPVRQRQQVPSFTIISNRCAHLGCPVQANGPSGAILGEKTVHETTRERPGHAARRSSPAGFGCPCHGGQYDTEGNRTAGPPVRALDRYDFEINNGRLVLLSTFSVSHVDGTGAQAQDPQVQARRPRASTSTARSRWLYPLQPPHH